MRQAVRRPNSTNGGIFAKTLQCNSLRSAARRKLEKELACLRSKS